MKLLQRLWSDEAGFIISSELVLVATILVIGMIVGLVSLRNQVVQELVDVGQAIGMVSQGYEYTGVSKVVGTATIAETDGSGYDDLRDQCQTTPQTAGAEPGGILVTSPGPVYPNTNFGEV